MCIRDRFLECGECGNDSRQFHTVVGGAGSTAGQFFGGTAVAQDRSIAARAWVSRASAVGKMCIRDSLCIGSEYVRRKYLLPEARPTQSLTRCV